MKSMTMEDLKASVCRWSERAWVAEERVGQLEKELKSLRPQPAADGLIEYQGWLYQRTEEKAK